MTIDEFIQIGRVRSKMDVYKRRKDLALQLSAQQLEGARNPYLALSGGKDSVAMAFIVDEAARQTGKTFRIWSHLSDASFPGTEETCREVADRLGRPLDIYMSEGSAFDALSAKERRAFGKSGVFFDSVRAYAQDKDLAFVGVRAAESKRRRQAANAHGAVFRSVSMGDVTVCNPLLWFELLDVAAALWEYDAPIHPIYRKTPVSVGKREEDSFIRLSYATSKDLLNKGTAVFIKLNYPEIYARLVEAWPDIKRFT